MWKRHVKHLWKTIDSPREEVAVPEIADESQIASPLQSYQDPPAVHLNEGGTLASSLHFTLHYSIMALLHSSSLYLTVHYSTIAVLHSTYSIMALLYFTWLYITRSWFYVSQLISTLLYHGSTSL